MLKVRCSKLVVKLLIIPQVSSALGGRKFELFGAGDGIEMPCCTLLLITSSIDIQIVCKVSFMGNSFGICQSLKFKQIGKENGQLTQKYNTKIFPILMHAKSCSSLKYSNFCGWSRTGILIYCLYRIMSRCQDSLEFRI